MFNEKPSAKFFASFKETSKSGTKKPSAKPGTKGRWPKGKANRVPRVKVLNYLKKVALLLLNLMLSKSVGDFNSNNRLLPQRFALPSAREAHGGDVDGRVSGEQGIDFRFHVVEHQQSQMPVKTVHVQSLIEGCSGLEHMILLIM